MHPAPAFKTPALKTLALKTPDLLNIKQNQPRTLFLTMPSDIDITMWLFVPHEPSKWMTCTARSRATGLPSLTGSLAAALLLWQLAIGVSLADQRMPGPIMAQVVRVVDGDTLEIDARIWPGQSVRTLVRVLGVDTPELRGKCENERDLALKAKNFLVQRLVGGEVQLRLIDFDKFGGRMLAQVWAAQGSDLAASLIASGLARPYQGGPRQSWC
jgi:endonuclease YncB( thermonuclease family)